MKTILLSLALVAFAMAVLIGWQPIKQFAIDSARAVHNIVTGYMARQGLLLCATYYSTEQTTLNGPMYGNAPATRLKANKQGGRIRIFEATYTVPVGGIAVADKIVWGKLPVKARTLGHLARLRWSAGAASQTLNLGDNASAARHLAATSVTTAGTATPDAAEVHGASFETSDDSANYGNGFVSATDDCTLISTVAGATLTAGQVITLRMPYVCD
jgi:hypothetical protein